ncbi:MAG: DUF5694 domain-containing protein [Rhodanobacter sp.]
MTNRWTSCGLLAALLWSGTALAQVDLSGLDQGMTGPSSQVLVLGSVHLSQMPDGFKADTLQPVLAKLAAFRPDIITVEAIPGESCAMMKRNPALYAAQDVATYCSDTTAAKKATGLDVPAAVAAVKESLAHWPARPHAAQRRHLAALFLASGDDASALTQWLQLPQAERHAGDGLDDALATRLRELQTRNGEDLQIAARLAARLGLQRVYPVDDHSGDNVDVPDVPAYANAIRNAWAASAGEVAADRRQQETLTGRGDMLALYRFINRPEVLRRQIDADMGAAMRDESPGHLARIYAAGWETRNLRMVANVRAAFRERPGARVLCIVGATHKPWFDSLLGQMQGVAIVDAEKVLQ